MVKMEKIIEIKTTRYSKLVERIFEEYHENIDIYIGSGHYTEEDIPELMKNLCTNRMLKNTIDFLICQDGKQLFGFHDNPDAFRADISVIEFVKKLANEKIIRYRLQPVRPHSGKSIVNKVLKIVRRLVPL